MYVAKPAKKNGGSAAAARSWGQRRGVAALGWVRMTNQNHGRRRMALAGINPRSSCPPGHRDSKRRHAKAAPLRRERRPLRSMGCKMRWQTIGAAFRDSRSG